MVMVVISSNGETKGYVVDSYYIGKDLLKYFTSVESLSGVRILGVSCGEDIKVRGKRYKSILKYMNYLYYKEVIEVLTLNGIKLNDILFVYMSIRDVSSVSSDVWRVLRNYDEPKFECIMVVTNNCQRVGYILTGTKIYHGDIFYINMIEVIEKRNGYGRRIINQLTDIYDVVKGLALVNSVDFWKSIGALFTDSGYHFSIGKGGCNFEVV